MPGSPFWPGVQPHHVGVSTLLVVCDGGQVSVCGSGKLENYGHKIIASLEEKSEGEKSCIEAFTTAFPAQARPFDHLQLSSKPSAYSLRAARYMTKSFRC